MAIDFQDWITASGPKQLKRGNSSAIAALTQAQPALEALTQQPHWDLFLSYVASAIKTWEEDLTKLAETMVRPLGIDDVLRVRNAMVRIRERIETARYISQLPSELIAAGDKALTLESRFEDKTGKGASMHDTYGAIQ